jgi:colanic acid/amylovoran biosynthesis glycosyltransferase
MAEAPLRLLVAGCTWPLETFLERLFEGLACAGVEVTISMPVAPDAAWLKTNGVRWLRSRAWDEPIPLRLMRLAGMALGAAFRGRRDLRLLKPHVAGLPRGVPRLQAWYRLLPLVGRRADVIYFPWNSAAISHFALFDLGIPVLVSCRGSQVNIGPHHPDRRDLRNGLRATFSRAAAVHCVSSAIEAEARAYGLDPAKSRVIRPAVNPRKFFPPAGPRTSAGPLRVIAVGSLSWRKGFAYALRALRAARDCGADLELEILGDGPDRQRLLFGIDDMGLSDRVRLSGEVPPEEVAERLRNADLFLLSSVSEGISNAALEAMATGLPVVTTDCGGMREAVSDGVEGFVVPARDVRQMAAALGRLAADAELRDRMGAAARNRILREFTLAGQVQRFAELLEEVRQCGRA